MALRKEDKIKVVAEVNEVAAKALSVVAVDYRGLTVAELTNLRAQARNGAIYLKVVPNNLAKLAFAGTAFECLADSMVGPTMLAASLEEPGAAPRLISEFIKTNDTMQVKVLSMGGVALGPEKLATLASLPTRDEALSQLARVCRAPVEQLARTLAEPAAQAARAFAAVRDAKQ